MADVPSALRVVVVDDDALMRDLLRRALEQLGVDDVRSADDGAAALALLDEAPADVMLCDLNMPGMDGIELLRHLAGRKDAPALAMVSGDDHVLRIAAELGQAHRLRVLGTIPKPATPEVIGAVLGRLVRDDAPPATPTTASGAPLDAEAIVALIPDGVELHFQPQIETATGRPVGIEALARLRHPTAGLLGPGLFVPLLEQRGITFSLTRVVARQALHHLRTWRDAGMDLRIAVNVSADDLGDVTIVGRLEAAASDIGVPLDAFTLEITESRIVPDAPEHLEVLSRMRLKGVGLSIDDFGTGFSSLEQLRRIPFHELKIDQTFVASATTDSRAEAMLESTVHLARELHLTTVAEGVETAEQLELVGRLGCDVAQGYFIARPMPADAATAWLTERLG